MASLYLVLVLVALGWPLVAAAAGALVIRALVRLTGGQAEPGATLTPNRWGWTLSAGTAMAAIACFGYGLTRTTFLSMTDADDRCALASRNASSYEHPFSPSSDGAMSLWPLRDTTCGPDLVPAFLNPLVVALAVLCLTLAVVTAAATAKRVRPRRLRAEP
ncbi:MAG TPA: hypothetical protein VN408_39700 [Actinoplanes sp.]|nr:hypothetical protein [Actinoplanes sp.]